MKLSEHFDSSEFTCKCSKHCTANPDKELISKLEKLFSILNARAIIITSGYRCPEHSISVGGRVNDAHTRNIAADIIVHDSTGKQLTSEVIAAGAERAGFSGIGIISAAAVHVDVRNSSNYVNSHWYGDERTGNDNIKTFINAKKQVRITAYIDDHKYSGLLEED